MESLRLLISVGHEFEQAPGDGEGQGSLVCCSPGGHKESDMTEQLNNNYPVSTVVMFLQNTRINRCVPCLPGKWTEVIPMVWELLMKAKPTCKHSTSLDSLDSQL